MSKQQHDQDEQQTPSGADASRSDKDESTPAPSETSGSSSPESSSSPPESDPSESGKPPRSRSRSRRRGKSAAADQAASDQPPTSSSDKQEGGDDKPAGPDEQPGSAGEKAASAAAGGERAAGAGKTPAGAGGKTPPKGGGGGASGGGTAGDGGQTGKRLGIAALVLVILLAVATLLVGWYGWQRLEAQQQRLAEVDSNAEAIADLESRFESSEGERQAALDEAMASLRDEFSSYRSEVDETLDRVLDELSSQQNADEREWLHAEAAYLLRLANQRLQLERDVEGAAALLRTADDRLRDADNPALVPVRREISSELAALDAVPRIDRTGLYLSLNAQQQQLARLPLKQDVEQIAAQAGDTSPPSGTWQQQLSRFGSELKELVTVRRHDEALEALITPEQESYLRQNVRLVLEQAQLALLKEEPELYQASLDKAMTLIRDYYATDRNAVQVSLDRLAELREASIRPELPDISGSQQALATFIERRFESPDHDEQGDEA